MKAINERGRHVGDRVLRSVADICRQSVRNIDLVARYRDDSFCLLLLMTDTVGARSVAERISQAVGSTIVEDEGEVLTFSVTIGLTTYPRAACTSIIDLLEIARAAQEDARRAGTTKIFAA